LGGGLELALACDFIIASENAKVGLPEVSLGLIPGFGGTVRLSRVVGLNIARELILTGDVYTAAQAQQWGLVSAVVPQAELLALAQKKAESILSRGPVAVQKARVSVLGTVTLPLREALGFEAEQFSVLFNTQDVKEGTQAFIQKRKPQFKGN